MQGGPLSPLLSNIYLDDLDKELEKRGLPFVRYADDFVIFTKTEVAAQRVYASVERFLTRTFETDRQSRQELRSAERTDWSMWATNFVAMAVRFG